MLANAPLGLQYSTTVFPASNTVGRSHNPFQAEGSGLNRQRQEPLYIAGLEPNRTQDMGVAPNGRRYYEWYTDYESSEETDIEADVPPRRKRVASDVRADVPEPRVETRSLEERIRAHENQIIALKRDLQREEGRRGRRPSRYEPAQVTNVVAPPPVRSEVVRSEFLFPPVDFDNPIPPFTDDIMNERISRKFKLPAIKSYDGTGDPNTHVWTFLNALLLQPVTDAIKCRAFPQTLTCMAQH